MKIVDLKPGEVISSPGFYRMSLDRHHNQPCDGPSVTSSVLRAIELDCPAQVWAFHKLNPERYEQDDKPAFRLGRAMAAYIEGAEQAMSRDFIFLPPSPPKRPTQQQRDALAKGTASKASQDAIEFWDGIQRKVEKDGKSVISWSEWELIEAMGKVLVKDPAACAALDGIPEVTMAWKDAETGLWLLARPDVIKFDGLQADYKKISTQGRPMTGSMIDRRIEQYGYDMQMAFGGEVFWRLTGNWPAQTGLVFQCDKPPYHVLIRGLTPEHMTWGMRRNRRALRTFAECLKSGHWPGPGEVIGNYQMSDWLEKRLIEQHGNGTLPDIIAPVEEAA